MKTNHAAVLVVLLFSACGPQEAFLEEEGGEAAEVGSELIAGLRGRPLGLDVAQWNVMWLGNTAFGPTDEADQLARVSAVIRSGNVDLWALQEVSSQSTFDSLTRSVPGFEGLAATDPRIVDGTRYYSSQEQRPALLFKTRAVTLNSARLILTESASAFAGRPPLEANLTVHINRKEFQLTVIVVHLKAGADADDRFRRETSSLLLQTHVATLSGPVLVLGDWNDNVTKSIVLGANSPFENWRATSGSWLTRSLEESGAASSVFGSFIDHAWSSSSLSNRYEETQVFDPRPVLPGYRSNTSDHFPVLHFFGM
jgi:endonuclease/exonuclease/phosphatase family metal-dependent hydrolase